MFAFSTIISKNIRVGVGVGDRVGFGVGNGATLGVALVLPWCCLHIDLGRQPVGVAYEWVGKATRRVASAYASTSAYASA